MFVGRVGGNNEKSLIRIGATKGQLDIQDKRAFKWARKRASWRTSLSRSRDSSFSRLACRLTPSLAIFFVPRYSDISFCKSFCITRQ